MCGIVGEMRVGGADRDWLVAAASCLAHRGPDQQGIWTSNDGTVGLGHRRLSVLDLSNTSSQPMTTPDGSITIAFNGEIYNFREVRDELHRLGYSFLSSGDTEVVLHSIAAWGDEALRRLDGMFAIAAYDARSRRLLLARDRAGEKPLYVWKGRDGVAFASELKAMLSHPGFPREISGDAMEWYLAYGYVPRELCIFAGVHKVRPGHFEWHGVDDAGQQREYWHLPEPVKAPPPKNELVDELDVLLADVVRQQLVSDVPIGVLLSGGLDSSLLTAYASDVAGSALNTFTVTFPAHSAFNESVHAARVAAHFGTNHTELAADEVSADILPVLARQYDEPLGDSSAVPTYLVSRLIRPYATVAIGGDGGDELFGGYPHYSWLRQQEIARSFTPATLRNVLARTAAARPVGTRGRNQLMGLAESVPGSIARANLLFGPDLRTALVGRWLRDAGSGRPERAKMQMACASGEDAAAASARVDFLTYLPDDLLVKVDRASMLASLEVRAPFLDRRILEFAFGRVPSTLRATARHRKILLRELARRRLPRDFDRKRKQGFSIPLGEWFNGPWRELLHDTLLAGTVGASFNQPVVAALLAGQRGATRNAQRLYALLMFELWRREHRISLLTQ